MSTAVRAVTARSRPPSSTTAEAFLSSTMRRICSLDCRGAGRRRLSCFRPRPGAERYHSGVADGELNDKTPFATARFSGERFEPEGMPASSLLELVNLDRAIRQVARTVRKNLGASIPRDLNARFDLRMVGVVKTRSAEATLVRSSEPALFHLDDEFDQSFETIVRALRWGQLAVTGDAGEPPEQAVLTAAASLGSTLLETEFMTVISPSGETARCTRDSRRRLLTAATPDSEVRSVTVLGRLVVASYEPRLMIKVQQRRGMKVPVQLLEPLPIEVTEAANSGQRSVIVRGDGVYKAVDRLVEVAAPTEVYSVAARAGSPMARTPKQFRANVARVSARRPGWLDGVGSAPDEAALAALVEVISSARTMFGSTFPLVGLTDEGGIILDWVREPWRLGGELETGQRVLELFAVHADGRRSTFKSLDLSAPTAAADLAEFIDFVRVEGNE